MIDVTHSQFFATWVIEAKVSDVPDRALQYSSTGRFYRPGRVTISFETGAQNSGGPSALILSEASNGAGPLTVARENIKIAHATIYGPWVKKDGSLGQNIADETFYNLSRGAPDWLIELADRTREQLSNPARVPSEEGTTP